MPGYAFGGADSHRAVKRKEIRGRGGNRTREVVPVSPYWCAYQSAALPKSPYSLPSFQGLQSNQSDMNLPEFLRIGQAVKSLKLPQ